MTGSIRLSALVAAIIAAHGLSARAQDYFAYAPYGSLYGIGWGASTVHGDLARGMGAFAVGAGIYHRATAEAMAIEAHTAMQCNEYLWVARQKRALRYRNKLAASRTRNIAMHHEIDRRLHSRPEPRDIQDGDALNVLLSDLTGPSVYRNRFPEERTLIGCRLIREIPLNYAPGGVTVSLNEIAGGASPKLFRTGVVAANPRRFIAFETSSETDPNMTLAALIAFMDVFDLRFGVATTPSQREAYEALYPALSRLHHAALGAQQAAEVATK